MNKTTYRIPANIYKLLLCCILLLSISLVSNKIIAQSNTNKLFGITIDESSFNNETLQATDDVIVENIISEIALLKAAAPIGVDVIVRIVLPFGCEGRENCDESEKNELNKLPIVYKTLMQKIKEKKLALIMAQLMDSDIESSGKCMVLNNYAKSVDMYLNRTKAMYAKIGNLVDIWEIGNEVNGDWVGGNVDGNAKNLQRRKIIVGQLYAAYSYLENQKQTIILANKTSNEKAIVPATAITYYFSGIDKQKHSYENDNDALLGWLASDGEHFKNASGQKIQFTNLDYALISYYPEDNFYTPTNTNTAIPIVLNASEWATLFSVIKNNFSAVTKFGLGEVGAQCYYSRKPKNCADCKTLLLDYDTQEKNPCNIYDNDGEATEERNCFCCQCLQTKVAPEYYQDLHTSIIAELNSNKQFANSNNFIGGYFNWYYSADVVNKNLMGISTDKEQAQKVRTSTLDALRKFSK